MNKDFYNNNKKYHTCDACQCRSVRRPSYVVRFVVISRKLSKIDLWLELYQEVAALLLHAVAPRKIFWFKIKYVQILMPQTTEY